MPPPPNRLFYPIVFALLTFAFGAYFIYATPPGQGPDERNHIGRAWAISTGELFPSTEGNRRGGEVPATIQHMEWAYIGLRFTPWRKVLRDSTDFFANMPLEPEKTNFQDYPNTAVYPWLVYAPAATGLATARTLNLSTLGTARAARWAGLLFWIPLGMLALWLLPAWRGLFTALFLLPMTTWTHAMISADTATNAVALLTIAYQLHLAFEAKQRVGWKQVATLTALGLLVASTKLVYVPILLLSVLIPARRFDNPGGKWAAAGIIGALTLATLFYWSHQSSEIYLPYPEYSPEHRIAYIGLMENANLYEQRALIIKAPYRLFRAAVNSVIDVSYDYTRGYIGILGWLDTPLPPWSYVLAYVYLFFLAATARLTTWQTRLTALISFVLCYLFVILSQLLSWEDVGSHTVEVFQGRYLVPMAPLVFLLLPIKTWKWRGRKWVVTLGSFCLLLIASWALIERYYPQQ